MATLRSALALTCLVSTSALVFASACGSDDDESSGVADGGRDATSEDATAAGDASVAAFTDGQIYELLVTFNQGAITEADTAVGAASTPAVRELAGGFAETYSNLQGQLTLFAQVTSIVTEGSDAATALTAATTADEAKYASLAGADFDAAYLAAQISACQAFLNLIDAQLTADIVNPNVGGFLATERHLVAANLASVQAVQEQASADAGPDASADATVADAAADAADAADSSADGDGDAADGEIADGSSDASDVGDANAADASDAGDSSDSGDGG